MQIKVDISWKNQGSYTKYQIKLIGKKWLTYLFLFMLIKYTITFFDTIKFYRTQFQKWGKLGSRWEKWENLATRLVTVDKNFDRIKFYGTKVQKWGKKLGGWLCYLNFSIWNNVDENKRLKSELRKALSSNSQGTKGDIRKDNDWNGE